MAKSIFLSLLCVTSGLFSTQHVITKNGIRKRQEYNFISYTDINTGIVVSYKKNSYTAEQPDISLCPHEALNIILGGAQKLYEQFETQFNRHIR